MDKFTIDLNECDADDVFRTVGEILAFVRSLPIGNVLDAGQKAMVDHAIEILDTLDTELMRGHIGKAHGEDLAWADVEEDEPE